MSTETPPTSPKNICNPDLPLPRIANSAKCCTCVFGPCNQAHCPFKSGTWKSDTELHELADTSAAVHCTPVPQPDRLRRAPR